MAVPRPAARPTPGPTGIFGACLFLFSCEVKTERGKTLSHEKGKEEIPPGVLQAEEVPPQRAKQYFLHEAKLIQGFSFVSFLLFPFLCLPLFCTPRSRLR